MAGSFNHIVDDNGYFTMALVEDGGDAYEALEECFDIIHELTDGQRSRVEHVTSALYAEDRAAGMRKDRRFTSPSEGA